MPRGGEHWRLARLRDAVTSLKSLAANLEFLTTDPTASGSQRS
jgi:hypothetical protein